MSNSKASKWLYVVLALLLLYLLESALLPWLVPELWRTGDLLVYPKPVLVAIVFIAMFTSRHIGVLMGFLFGLLQDVVFYGHMIGVNAFTFAAAGYAAGLLARPGAIGLFVAVLIQTGSLLMYEISIYGLYRLFNVTDVEFGWIFVRGMLPSVLASLFLALTLYIPARKWLDVPSTAREADEE